VEERSFKVCGTGAALPFLERKWTRRSRRSIAVCSVDWCGCRQESIRGCVSHRQHVCHSKINSIILTAALAPCTYVLYEACCEITETP
jgi:hypothetical protein